VLLPKIDCFSPVGRLRDDSHVWFMPDQRDQTFAHNAMIVGNKHGDAALGNL